MNIQNMVPAFMTKKVLIILAGILVLCSIAAAVFVATSQSSPSAAAAAIIGFTTPVPTTSGVQVSAGSGVRSGTYTLEPSTPPPFYDFMVPDVCLDGSGNPTSQDPATCTKKRNLRIGESMPYIISDYASAPGWQQSYIYTNSFPVIHKKDIRVVQTREWGANSGHPDKAAFRDFGPLDAYDIMSSYGEYVSSIGTRDPITNSPGWYWAQPDCSLKDSWIQFPIGLKKGDTSYTVAKLIGGYLPCKPSPNAYSTSMTVWNWYATPLPYTSGKNLESIQTWHHSGRDPIDATKALDAMEVFRWTKEYGLTRWEGWVTATSTVAELMGWKTAEEVAAVVKLDKDSKGCDGGDPLDRWGNIMYRWGCGDWSFVFAPDAKRGPVNPYSFPIKKEFVTSLNLLSTDETKARADAAGGSLLGWKTLTLGGGKEPKLSAGFDASTSKNLPTPETPTPGNGFYKLECTDACGTGNPRSMYLDVNPNDIVKEYGVNSLVVQAGALVRGPAKALDAAVVVHMIDAKGAVIGSRSSTVNAVAPALTGRVNSLTVTPATATSTARLTVTWSALGAVKTIPLGSKVLIGRNVYTTNVNTGVGVIYLPPTTTGIVVGDYVKYIQSPDGTVIYSDVGTTSTTNKWQQVRFNFDWDFAAQPVSAMRYEIYVRSPGEYQFDEMFLALLPRDPKLPVVTVTTTPVVTTTTATTTGTTATTTSPGTTATTTTTTTTPTTGTATTTTTTTTTTTPSTGAATTTTTAPTTTTPPTTTGGGGTVRPGRSELQ